LPEPDRRNNHWQFISAQSGWPGPVVSAKKTYYARRFKASIETLISIPKTVFQFTGKYKCPRQLVWRLFKKRNKQKEEI